MSSYVCTRVYGTSNGKYDSTANPTSVRTAGHVPVWKCNGTEYGKLTVYSEAARIGFGVWQFPETE